MIFKTYYRSQLSPTEQLAYKDVVNALMKNSTSVVINISCNEVQSIRRIVRAVHLDHPELFYVNFWSYKIQSSGFPTFQTRLLFQMLLDTASAKAVFTSMESSVARLYGKFTENMSIEQRYLTTLLECISSASYKDTESAFWDHTAAGPVLNHSAVCEGFSKLFLFYCQRADLSCAIITGTLGGVPHAWNMIQIHGSNKYVDVTGLLKCQAPYRLFPNAVLRSKEQLTHDGYVWSDSA